MELIDFILHIDQHLVEFINAYGTWIYAILFLIIFVETGVVIMPFLPGDSLLFAAGMLAANPENNLNVWIVIILLLIAAVAGDSLNYSIGREFGARALKVKLFGRTFVKQEHINKTHEFYQKYGSKTIVIARFVPFVRTLAPFVAGVGKMNYKTFISYNIIGGILWVVGITLAGYFTIIFADKYFPEWNIKDNFSKIVMGIIIISLLPILFEFAKEKFFTKKTGS